VIKCVGGSEGRKQERERREKETRWTRRKERLDERKALVQKSAKTTSI
jgi:hypothetical protein